MRITVYSSSYLRCSLSTNTFVSLRLNNAILSLITRLKPPLRVFSRYCSSLYAICWQQHLRFLPVERFISIIYSCARDAALNPFLYKRLFFFFALIIFPSLLFFVFCLYFYVIPISFPVCLLVLFFPSSSSLLSDSFFLLCVYVFLSPLFYVCRIRVCERLIITI